MYEQDWLDVQYLLMKWVFIFVYVRSYLLTTIFTYKVSVMYICNVFLYVYLEIQST